MGTQQIETGDDCCAENGYMQAVAGMTCGWDAACSALQRGPTLNATLAFHL